MIVVRWLGAFGKYTTLQGSVEYEISAPADRQVASEPLFDGRCRLSSRAEIGLLVDQTKTRLIAVFTKDAWTVMDKSGRLKNKRHSFVHQHDWDSLKKICRTNRDVYGHGECIIQGPKFSGIVVRYPRKKRVLQMAREAAGVTMPIMNIQGDLI